MNKTIDIIIPVFNEGKNILKTLESIFDNVSYNFNVLICYDFDNDDTLKEINNSKFNKLDNIIFVKNKFRGPHSAVMTGIKKTKSDLILVMPADDDYNAKLIDKMINLSNEKKLEIVCPSRFINGISLEGASLTKKILVITANYCLKKFAKLPVHDSTNGFRLFSKKIINNITIESSFGFTYSIEYLVKAHRYGYKIGEIPAIWKERKFGKSRFKIIKWILPYMRWFLYAFYTSLKKNK